MTPEKNIVTAEVVEVPRPDYWIGVSVKNGTAYLWSNKTRLTRQQLADDYAPWDPPQFIVCLPGSTPQPQPAAPEADAVAEKHRVAKLETAVRAMRMVLVDAAQYEEHQIIKSPWLGQMQLAIKKTEGLV